MVQELRIHQCGLPKQMALELFKPFVISWLIPATKSLAHNIRSATRLIESGEAVVWVSLDAVIEDKYVLLNDNRTSPFVNPILPTGVG